MSSLEHVQLSAAQRSFVQFCSTLQELILNQQVAHSVVESLQADLPALQQGPPAATSATAQQAVSASGGGRHALGRQGGQQRAADGGVQAQLLDMAPRLTPCPALFPRELTHGSELTYRAAAESQDSYIVLQNAALKAKELLARMSQLQQQAAAAVAEGQGWEEGTSAEEAAAGTDKENTAARPAAGAAVAGGCYPQHELQVAGGTGGDEAIVGMGMDVDVEVEVDGLVGGLQLGAADADQADGERGAATPGAAPPHTPKAGGASSTPTGPAAAAAAAPVSGGGEAAAAAATAPALCGAELAMLMRELCREAGLEVELLERVAAGLELRTPPEELHAAALLLQLQPYLHEQLLAAALAQRDALLPRAQQRPAGQQPGGRAGRAGSGGRGA